MVRTSIGVQERRKKLFVVREGVSLQQIIDGLNAMGIRPRDHHHPASDQGCRRDQADIEVM